LSFRCVDLAAGLLNKRKRLPGFLIPDLVYNHDPVDLTDDGTGLGARLARDSAHEALVIVGSSLKTGGPLQLVKWMAQRTRMAGGVVVYVDRRSARTALAEFMDMHIQADIQDWSTWMLETLGDNTFLASGHIQDRARRQL
jgi:NAD-dependent SIR2 family protein deacetylase